MNEAMRAIEKENPDLADVLPKSYHILECRTLASLLKTMASIAMDNCLRGAGGDESVALAKVRQKYLDDFLKTDLHFFLGTLKEFHGFSPNSWVIIGVLPLPHLPPQQQLPLFD